ncbi:response regulator [Idiomarina xiamenensis]|uniref:Response regulator n=1 Tax=Idiomarina xiamenensis 10-D-4 TaxID=740709 RepID=K2JFP9_9GAMM|nr:response regulator [Idiomarina xiamenensis]EKE82121.1 response regulator [Idiomarina xiamenensis 10-D-4]
MSDAVHVIVVEPDNRINKAVTRLASSVGNYFIHPCQNLGQAIDIASSQPISVLLCDSRALSKRSEYLLTFFREQRPKCFRLLMQLTDNSLSVAELKAFAAHETLRRPFDKARLITLLQAGRDYLANAKAHQAELNASSAGQVEQAQLVDMLYLLLQQHPLLGGVHCQAMVSLSDMLAQSLQLTGEARRLAVDAGKLALLGYLSLPEKLVKLARVGMQISQWRYIVEHLTNCYQIMPSSSPHLVALRKILVSQYASHLTFDDSSTANFFISEVAAVLAVARDAIRYRDGFMTGSGMSIQRACQHLQRDRSAGYAPTVLQALAELSEKQALNRYNKQFLCSIEQLRPGLVLTRNIYNSQNLLLMATGHRLTQHSIDVLKKLGLQSRELLVHVQDDSVVIKKPV